MMISKLIASGLKINNVKNNKVSVRCGANYICGTNEIAKSKLLWKATLANLLKDKKFRFKFLQMLTNDNSHNLSIINLDRFSSICCDHAHIGSSLATLFVESGKQ
jgi:hypothetical protein